MSRFGSLAFNFCKKVSKSSIGGSQKYLPSGAIGSAYNPYSDTIEFGFAESSGGGTQKVGS